MSDIKLGHLIEGVSNRDAIHIAVAPVEAVEKMAPGDHIGFAFPGSDTSKVSLTAKEKIGIVDPFLPSRIFPGDKFYMVLYPQSITSLRHEWAHPAFKTGPEAIADHVEESRKWLMEYANCLNISLNEMLQQAEEQDYLCAQGISIHEGDVGADFRLHYQRFTGKPAREELAVSCSC